MLVCQGCEREFPRRRTRSKFCGTECRNEAAKRARISKLHPVTCVACGKEFLARRAERTICYDRACRNARHNLNRTPSKVWKLRLVNAQVGAHFSRLEIFDRDGGICHICRQPVDPSLRWPHLMSWTLDHLIPLVDGGTHEPMNVALAHLSCNSKRNATGEPRYETWYDLAKLWYELASLLPGVRESALPGPSFIARTG